MGHTFSHPLYRYRVLLEYSVLLLLIALPVSGVFWIDVTHGQFLVSGHHIRFSDSFIIIPAIGLFFSSIAFLYSVLGLSFCGWMCPQNTFSELATKMTKFLGGRGARMGTMRESEISVESSRNVSISGLILTSLLLIPVSLLMTYIPLLYFLKPDVLWAHLSSGFQQVPFDYFNAMFFFFTGMVWIDFTFIRHTWCKYFCAFHMLQMVFLNRKTLRIGFDRERENECAHCDMCHTSCFLDIDPKAEQKNSHCINCGECIIACEEVSAKRGTKPFLKYTYGDVSFHADAKKERKKLLTSRNVLIPGVMVIVFSLWLFAGLSSFQPVEVRISKSATKSFQQSLKLQGEYYEAFQVRILNKDEQARSVFLTVEGEGISEKSLVFRKREVLLAPLSQFNDEFLLNKKEVTGTKGLHHFTVKVVDRLNKGVLAKTSFTFYLNRKGE